MGPIEEAVRYTTWFGKVSDAVIPFYLSIVISTFLLWLLLSYLLHTTEFMRRGSAPGTLDRESFANSSFHTGDGLLPSARENSTSLPLHTSTVISSPHNMRLWIIRLLALVMTFIFYSLHQDVVRRLKWQMYLSLALTIFLHVAQCIISRPMAFLGTNSTNLGRLSHFCAAPVQSSRYHLLRCMSQKRAFQVQSGIAVLVCVYVALVFVTNEPLSKPLPKDVGLPRKMCAFKDPSVPFSTTFAEYIQFHNAMLAKPKEEQRILVYHTVDEGLGNRLEGLVSAFALALVTNRAFIIDWRAQSKCNAKLGDLFTNPGFAWEVVWKTLEWDFGKREMFYYAYCRACPIRSRNPDGTEAWEKLLCEENAGFETDTRIASVKSTQWFAPVLAMNPHLQAKFCSLFGTDLYATVAPFLLRLIPELQQRKAAFKAQQGWTDSQEVVSLQIRRLEGFGVSNDIADSFLQCAATISESSNTKYFLATDHMPTRKRFKETLKDKLIHLDSTFDRGSVRGIQDAVLEIWLLGEANNMIMSPYSTFGDISHARTGLVPHKVGHNGQCTKQLTSHPCFFYYFGMFDLKCFDKNMVLAELTNQQDCYL